MNPGAGANRALRGWRSVWALGIGLIAGPALLVGTPALASDSFGPSSPVAATAPLAKSAPVAAGQPATDQAIWGDPSVLRPAPAAGSALAVSAGRLLVLRPDGVLESRALDGSERASVRLAVLPGLAATALFPTQDGVLIVGTSAKTGGYQAHYLGLRAGQGPVVALPPLPAGFVLTAATAVGSTVFLADAAGATLRFDLAAASAPGAPAGQWAALGRAPMHCDRTWLSHQYDGTAERLFAACLDRAAGAIEVARWDERGGWTAGGKTTVADPVLTVAPHGQSNLLALTSAAGQAGQVQAFKQL